jgi:hypothetical protein
MKRRNMTLGKAIREYILAHPDASTEAVMEATGCKTKQQVYQARTYLTTQGLLKKAAAGVRDTIAAAVGAAPAPVNLEVEMPASGLRLKLREGKRMVGTLGITHTGIKFTPANGKKVPERQVAWRILKALSGIDVG